MQLLSIVLAVVADAGEQGVAVGSGHQLLLGGQKRIVAGASGVLDFQVEAGGVTQFAHGGRHGRGHLGIVNLGERRLGAVDNGEHFHVVRRTQLEVLHPADDHALVLALTGEIVAGDGENVLDRLVLSVHILNLFQDRTRLRSR